MDSDRDYVLGTHDAEILRLALQHNVWRARAFDAWITGGFTAGQTLLDVGCGPGYATLDLAGIVGRSGRVVAVDRSARFLDCLKSRAGAQSFSNVEPFQADLDTDELPTVTADGAWVRWVFAFVKEPKLLVRKIAQRLRPGGTLVIHEYFDYKTWRLAPRSETFEWFVTKVVESWRADGGEPDVGLDLPIWLQDEGFEVVRREAMVEVIERGSFRWQWPATFLEVGLERLVDLGLVTLDEASKVRNEFHTRERDERTFMIPPSVLEIVARRQ
jgi:ubiquinone/menaquinone biosynthesis C-methylase UbiE